MQKIPTKFFGNPVKTKSELLYLHYQVFREWGKARCSGKHKGIRSMKQGNKNYEYSSRSIKSCVWGTPRGSSGCTDEEEHTHTPEWTHTHHLTVHPGLFTRRKCLTEDHVVPEDDFGQVANLLLLLCCGILYFWKVVFNHKHLFSSKTLARI